MLGKIVSEIKTHKIVYLFLGVVLALSFFVRVYRINDLLGFYYDQGRDALVIWKLIHEGKLFLIGPVTGLPGIFLGPFYYYLITPFYLIGGGNPIIPAIFLGFLSTLAVFLLYYLGAQMLDRSCGLIAAFIGGFSYNIILSSRWLSNPTPILLSSLIVILSMFKIASGKSKYWWAILGLTAGLSMQFESASAIFYIPILIIFSIWQYMRLKNAKLPIMAAAAFGVTLLPQIIFNFKHQNILFDGFSKLFVQQESFGITKYLLENRLKFLFDAFSSKIFLGYHNYSYILLFLIGVAFFVYHKVVKKHSLIIIAMFLLTACLGYILFKGNQGVVYDYYLTGYFLPFILLISLGLGLFWKSRYGILLVLLFFYIFFSLNLPLVRNMLIDPRTGPTDIKYGSQMKAVDWVFKDVAGEVFNVDVYVPPVIPYAYDYLFLWQATKRCGKDLCGLDLTNRVKNLYILFEQDPPHPERLKVWMDKQDGIGDIVSEARFGGITVQKRYRK